MLSKNLGNVLELVEAEVVLQTLFKWFVSELVTKIYIHVMCRDHTQVKSKHHTGHCIVYMYIWCVKYHSGSLYLRRKGEEGGLRVFLILLKVRATCVFFNHFFPLYFISIYEKADNGL